jgi:hypothetical protein
VEPPSYPPRAEQESPEVVYGIDHQESYAVMVRGNSGADARVSAGSTDASRPAPKGPRRSQRRDRS